MTSEIEFEGRMVALPDRRAQPVMTFRDLLEIIDHYCGFDVRNMVRDCIRDLARENEELEMENRDYQRTLECNNEEERDLLLSIRDEAEALMDELAKGRPSRRKLQQIGRRLFEIVNDEL